MEGGYATGDVSSGAYGSPGASGEVLNPLEFLKKPQVILRILSWVFAVIVFGCISSSAWESGHCYFGAKPGDTGACVYGTTVGVLAFLVLMAFIALDAMFDNISNAIHRKYIVIGDIAISGVLAFLWFVCFCYLADAWRQSNFESYWRGVSGIQAAIAFAFFSIGSFVGLTVLAVLKYREGIPTVLSPQYNADPFGGFETDPTH